MDRMLFVAMSGAKETMKAQAINTNNLANASTTGFRADFQSSLSQPVYGPGHPSRVYATTSAEAIDFSPGTIISTGRDLDAAIAGKGWFAVQAADGSEAYTRAGDLRMDNTGRITNGAGFALLGNGGPISIPAHSKLQIGSDGTISIQPLGQSASTLAIIDRIKLVNPENSNLQKGTDGLMHTRNGVAAQEDGSVSVVSASLESSNVNTIGAMVRMIELSRQYEHQIKIMSTAEENDRASAQIMQLS